LFSRLVLVAGRLFPAHGFSVAMSVGSLVLAGMALVDFFTAEADRSRVS